MSNLSDTKLVSGRTPVIGYSTRKANVSDNLSEVLPPDAYEGSFIYANGQMNFSNGTEWTTTEPPPISTPTPRTPTTSFEQRQLRLTNFRTSKDYTEITQMGVIFQVSLTSDMLNPITLPVASTTSYSYNLAIDQKVGTTRLRPGTKFYWRGQYTGTGGQESAFSRTQEQTFPEYIDPPIAKTLADTTQNVIEINTYVSAFNLPDEIDSVNYTTQWRGYANSSGTPDSLIFSKDDNDHDSKYDTLNDTESGQVYYWQARQVSFSGADEYESPWSTLQKQRQISNIGVPTPVSKIGVPLVELEITPFVSNTQPKALLGTAIWEVYNNQEEDSRLLVEKVTVVYNDQATTETALVKKTPEAMAKFQTEDFVNLDTEVPYYWRARYETNLGNSSEWSTLIPLRFIKPAYINTPISTVASDVELYRFQISNFTTYYPTVVYTSTIWEIFDSTVVLPGTTPLATFPVTSGDRNISPYIISQQGLKPEKTYYWRATYTGSYKEKTITSKPTALNAYKQPYSLQKPRITNSGLADSANPGVADNTKIRGPEFTFTTTTWSKIPNIVYTEDPFYSMWELYLLTETPTPGVYNEQLVDYFDRTKFTGGNPNVTTWKTLSLVENSKYKVRVKHTGISGNTSAWSDFVRFDTQKSYNDVITPLFTPPELVYPEVGTINLALGSEYTVNNTFIGYNAGKMWQQIAQTDTRIATTISYANQLNYNQAGYIDYATRKDYLQIYFLQGSDNKDVVKTTAAYWYTFDLTDEYNNPYSQQTSTKLFYLGQVVRLRSKWDKYTCLEGYVVKAFGTKLIVGVYKITLNMSEDDNSKEFGIDLINRRSVTVGGGWWIQARHYIIVSPPNYEFNDNGRRMYTEPSSRSEFYTKNIPYQCLSLTNGYASTRALYNEYIEGEPYTLFQQIGSYVSNGWYIPSRDELLLAFNTFCRHTGSISTSGGTNTSIGGSRHGTRNSVNKYQQYISPDFDDYMTLITSNDYQYDEYLINPEHTDEAFQRSYNANIKPLGKNPFIFTSNARYFCSTLVFEVPYSYGKKYGSIGYEDAKKMSTFDLYKEKITAPRTYSGGNIQGQIIQFNVTSSYWASPGYIDTSGSYLTTNGNTYIVRLFKRVLV